MLDGDFSQHGALECTKITLKELQENIHNLDISHDGKYVAYAMGNGCVKVYDTANMKLQARGLMGNPFDGLPSTSVRWGRHACGENGYMLANASSVGGTLSWMWGAGHDFLERHMRHPEEKNDTAALEFSLDGKHLYSAGSDKNIRVYDVETKQQVHVLNKGVGEDGSLRNAHANRIFSLKFVSPTSFISGGWQSPIQIWDVRTGKAERQVAGAHPSSDCLEPVLGTTRFLCCSGRPNDQIQVFDFVAAREIPEESAKINKACGNSQIVSISLRPETGTLWAAAIKPNSEVLQIDARTGELKDKVPCKQQLMKLVTSPHMPKRCIAGAMSETTYVIDE